MPSIREVFERARDAHRRGRLDAAAGGYQDVLKSAPSHVEALHALGILEAQRGRFAEASRRLAAAVDAAGAAATTQMRLDAGHAMLESGEPAPALTHFEQILSADGRCEAALAGAGVALWQLGRASDALAPLDRLIETGAAGADDFNTRGLALLDLDRPAEALENFDTALKAVHDAPDYHSNRAAALLRLQRPAEALEAGERALRLMPDYAPAWINSGTALIDLRRPAEALPRFERAAQLAPDNVDGVCGRCDALVALGRAEEAFTVCDRAIAAGHGSVKLYGKRGLMSYEAGRVSAALRDFEAAKAIDGADSHILNCIAVALQAEGRATEAVGELKAALAAQPAHGSAYDNLLFIEAYRAQLSSEEYVRLARGWEAAQLPAAGGVRKWPGAAARNNGRLRVGYVSGDFRRHAVSHFIEQLWRNHSRDRVEVFAYASYRNPLEDPVSTRLRGLADHWRDVQALPTGPAVELIRRDAIDVLIDLSGRTAHNRLDIFAARAAPVQAHYLGYFATTGIAAMDYWIGDSAITPPATDAHFSETVWRLPRVWLAYSDGGEAPAPEWRPAADGRIRFGSFNVLQKLDAPTLALWARVLDAVPGSRLVLKTGVLGDAGVRERFGAILSAAGLAIDRIEFVDPRATRGWAEHMASYAGVDIALDPVGGVCGGTTSCDALWMGVPVVTMPGERMGSRMTASMLDAIGRPEWIASTADEYIAKVVALARDVDLRKQQRATQRAAMAASPLCDARGLACALEDAYHAMLERAFERARTEQS